MIVAWGVSDLMKKWHYRKIYFSVFATIILTTFTARTFFQTSHWKNGVTLFEHAIKVTENNYKAQNNLGTAYALVDIDKAIFHYKEALKIKPDYVTSLYNLGTAILKKGNLMRLFCTIMRRLKFNQNMKKHTIILGIYY